MLDRPIADSAVFSSVALLIRARKLIVVGSFQGQRLSTTDCQQTNSEIEVKIAQTMAASLSTGRSLAQ